MSGSSIGQSVGPISLPFSFDYYENDYTSVYIAASGYLAFTDEGTWPWQPRVPSPAAPNNIIAPYATPLDLANGGTANRVYYKSGGAAPNRYFAVEWYRANAIADELYTFEVILYESGDIVFQYKTMSYSGGYDCGAAGIEDSMGLDGLSYVDFCAHAPSDQAVRFYRPAPSARVGIRPLHYGTFTSAGETTTFEILVRNTGDLGADTYDVTVSSGWPVSLYDAGGAPLADDDSDGTIDTDRIAQGSSRTIRARVAAPSGLTVGDDNTASVTFRSSVNVGESKTVRLQTAVPAPFAQAYRDDADGAMSLDLVRPGAQTRVKTTSDGYWASDLARPRPDRRS
jgi:hypothetical protein